jgi:hypothetical protein
MNKKIITAFIIMAALAFMPISAKADYPTGTLGYSDDIVAGNEYKWTVSKLDLDGDFADYSDQATLGGEYLSQGATIKIVVTDDPDNGGDWFEIYLGNTLLPNATFGDLLDYGFYYTFGGFFINPVTYTNATGTYGIYEQLLEEVEGNNEEYSDSYSTVYSNVTVEYEYSYKLEFSIKNDVFVIHMSALESMSMIGGGYDVSQYINILMETTININTGLIGKIEYMADVNLGISTSTIDGKMHLLIDSGYAKTPYSWAFSFLGLTIVAAVVGLIRRKR